jgi:hypothetical protein
MSNLDIPFIASTENCHVEEKVFEAYNEAESKPPQSPSSYKVNVPTDIQPRKPLAGMLFPSEPDKSTALSHLFSPDPNGEVGQLTANDEPMGELDDGTSQLPTKGGIWRTIRKYVWKKGVPNESCGVHDMV